MKKEIENRILNVTTTEKRDHFSYKIESPNKATTPVMSNLSSQHDKAEESTVQCPVSSPVAITVDQTRRSTIHHRRMINSAAD